MNKAYHFVTFKADTKSYHYQRLFVIFLGFFFSLSGLIAQSKFMNDLQISSYYHYGVVLPEYKHLLYVVEDYVHSAGLSISKKTVGKNEWQQLYKYPEYGFLFFYSTLGGKWTGNSYLSLLQLEPVFRKSIEYP
jgi:hypothetical protein